jgi:soluble lytic murein transglycosylase-like protein/TolA-binding protein
MRLLRGKWLIGVLLAALVLAGTVVAVIYFRRGGWRSRSTEVRVPMKPEAPPDLEKLRENYNAGVSAVRAGDTQTAIRRLSSFSFKGRAVEEYRLYYLAKALSAANDPSAARRTLARLWERSPHAVIADDAGAQLATFYARNGDWLQGQRVNCDLAGQSLVPANAARANWGSVQASINRGDVASALECARAIVVRQPKAQEAASALSIARSLTSADQSAVLTLSFDERLERAVGLMRDQDPASALAELTALEAIAPPALRQTVALNRGLVLNQLHRYEDSNRVLEPLTNDAFKLAIPALYTASKNYRSLAASINPMVSKTIVVRQRAPAVKAKTGKGTSGKGKKKVTSKPRFVNVKKTIQLVDLAKKAKREEYDRLASERLRDLLQLPQTGVPVRLEILGTLIPLAESKNQDAYEQQLIRQLVRIDRYADAGLQHFWDQAWAAYGRGDLQSARTLFRFIADTYGNPNVKRQADYWYARTIERAAERLEAVEIYRRLAAAPYDDVYALYSQSRGGERSTARGNPIASGRPDWRDIAERSMPQELRLAHELTALADFRDAAPEIEKNATYANRFFADALRAQKLNNDGNLVELYRVMRRAFPLLATVEQDSVPPYFLAMYYPVKYDRAIRKNAAKNGVDPYLVMALILQESYFNPHARSPVGAMGLMQIMPATGNELGRHLHGVFTATRLDDPLTNIEIGAFHLKHLLALCGGNTQLVAASYNAGQGNVLKWRRAAPRKPMDEFLESIPFPETRNYVKRVTLLRSAYSRIAQ